MLGRAIATLAFASLVAACSTVQPLSPTQVLVDRPERGAIAVAELGGVLLERAQSRQYDGIRLESRVEWIDLFGFRKFIIQPGRLAAKDGDDEFIYYYSEQMTSKDPITGITSPVTGGICIRKGNPDHVRAFVIRGACGIVPDQRPQFTMIQIADSQEKNYHQELIYAGRAGFILRFVYRELSGDHRYPTLEMDFQIDLSEGPTFTFRGARIEVVEATNAKLTYRVDSSFSEPPQ